MKNKIFSIILAILVVVFIPMLMASITVFSYTHESYLMKTFGQSVSICVAFVLNICIAIISFGMTAHFILESFIGKKNFVTTMHTVS